MEFKMISRRNMMISGAAAGGALLLKKIDPASAADKSSGGTASSTMPFPPPSIPQSEPAGDGSYTPVITPNGTTLPWTMIDGVKVFHLIAEEVLHEFAPGLIATCWGYNGRVHGPTIEAVEGDRVRI